MQRHLNDFVQRERVVACWEKFKGLFRLVEHFWWSIPHCGGVKNSKGAATQ